MRLLFIMLAILVTGCATTSTPTGDGTTTVPSAYDVPTTVTRLQTALKNKGMRVFATIDHAAGAKSVDQSLRPTTVVIFGNPKVGSRLMACAQKTGIDLPMKALIWEDAAGDTHLSYNSADWLASRHDLGACAPVLANVNKALAAFATAATRYEPPDISDRTSSGKPE